MANRLYFLNNTTNKLTAYDFSGSRQSADDITLQSASWRSVVATDSRFFAVLGVGSTVLVYAYDFSGNRQSRDDINLQSGSSGGGAVASNNRIYFINDSSDTAVAYDFSGDRQSANDISLGTGRWQGAVASNNRLYFINDSSDTAVAYDFSGSRQSVSDISLGTGRWWGGAASNNRLYFLNETTDTAVAYDFSGNRQSANDISLGTGSWVGGTSRIEPEANLTITTTDTDIRPNEQVNINIVSDIDISDFAATDITVRGGTRGTLTRTDARNYVLSVTAASSAGTMTVSIAEDVVSPGNAAVSQNFTINPNPVVKSDLVVSITGTTSIVQGQRTTLTAAVTDADDETLTSGLTYTWTASRGRFIGATDEASAVYEANFTDSSNVAVTITCAVTRPADTAPTSAGASLTALADIGVTGILVNMFMTALGAIASNSNNALYQDGSTGTLASGSDQALSSDITIWRIRWNNDSNRIILNNNASGSLQTYFTANTDKSLYVIFEDGTYVELPQANLVSTGTTWAQWSVTDANIVAKLNALTTTSDLLIGIADAGSIGIEANSGSGTATVTATPRPLPAPSVPASLSAAAIDHDSIRLTFSASTGTVTQYQYKIATSQVGLASATWNNGGTGTTIDVHGLTPSTQYYFQVRACNQTVYSAASNTANATTQAAPLPAPSTPGSLSATALDHDTIRLTFSASTGTVTQYQYKVATSSAGLSGAAWNNGGTATTINVDGLTPSTQYYFQVRALNQTVGSAASNTADATTQAPPLVAPSVPGSFAAAVVDHDTVRLTFSASTGTVTQYQYRYAISSAALSGTSWTDGGTGTSIDVNGLSPSTLYYFQVRACNQTVYSAATSAVTATTQAAPLVAPSAPASLSASAIDSDTIRLHFTASTGTVTQYQYKVATSEAGLASTTWNDGGTSTIITVENLLPSTQYFFQVRACNQTVYSSASNTANTTTQSTSVLPPGPLTIESIDEQFIPIETENYELVIRINRENVDARVRGLQEGFYQTFRKLGNGNSEIRIKSDVVTRLIDAAVWRIDAQDLDDDTTTFSNITYHVVPVGPILVDPGRQTIYKGVPFNLLVETLHSPSVQRGESELVGLKNEAKSIDERDYLESVGVLPLSTELTFTTFNADYYAENTGGFDELEVPFDIRDDAVAPVITGLESAYSYFQGASVNVIFQVTATPAPMVSLSDDSPEWLRVEHVSGTQYRIVGDIPEGTANYAFTVIAIGLERVTFDSVIQASAGAAPVFSVSDRQGFVGRAFSYSVSITGQTPITELTVNESITGVSVTNILNSNGEIIGFRLSGTPTVAGIYQVDVSATNQGGTTQHSFDVTLYNSIIMVNPVRQTIGYLANSVLQNVIVSGTGGLGVTLDSWNYSGDDGRVTNVSAGLNRGFPDIRFTYAAGVSASALPGGTLTVELTVSSTDANTRDEALTVIINWA